MAISEKDLDELSGVQKVAIILLSLQDDNATKVFSLMTEEEITEISRAMAGLGAITPEAVTKVMMNLYEDLTGDGSYLGNLDTTERLLSKILDDERVGNLIDEIKGPQGRTTWEKLTNVNEELLASYFKNEHPQTVALVLSKISPDHAAKVLANLPEQFAFDIIGRVLNIGNVKKDVLTRVERILRSEFISSASKSQKKDSFGLIAEIFNNLDRSNETKFMSMLESNIPEAASRIKDLMFTFDDLVKIDAKGIQRLLREVEKSRLTLALKGASDELKNTMLSSMSQRAAKIIEDDLRSLGAVRVKEVDSARSEIVSTAKRLIEMGEIDVALDNSDEFVT